MAVGGMDHPGEGKVRGRTPTLKYADYGNYNLIFITIIPIIITVPVIIVTIIAIF